MTNEYEAFALNYWGDEINYTVAKTKSLKGPVAQEILFYGSSNKPFALRPYLFGDLEAADLLHK